jgi:hypothetical protein
VQWQDHLQWRLEQPPFSEALGVLLG